MMLLIRVLAHLGAAKALRGVAAEQPEGLALGRDLRTETGPIAGEHQPELCTCFSVPLR
jgi:hypothetical protein